MEQLLGEPQFSPQAPECWIECRNNAVTTEVIQPMSTEGPFNDSKCLGKLVCAEIGINKLAFAPVALPACVPPEHLFSPTST